MINSNSYNFQFFLGSRQKVTNLYDAARSYGGATKYDDGIYSNIPLDEFIRINEINNNLSIFIPSTINTNEKIDNSSFVLETVNLLENKYNITNMKFYNTEGSWLDEKENNVVVENITIITVEVNEVSEDDILFFINLANIIKYKMNQQAVSISINDSLAIV